MLRKARRRAPFTVGLQRAVRLIGESHVQHIPARLWFSNASGGFATCPITQGTWLRLAMRLGGHGVEQALALLGVGTAHTRHHFWPDVLPYDQIRWHGVMGHRQVTDAYLAGLARHHEGKLASFDKGLVALHSDVGGFNRGVDALATASLFKESGLPDRTHQTLL